MTHMFPPIHLKQRRAISHHASGAKRSPCSRTSQLRTTATSPSSVSKALEKAIKDAQDCVEDCAANWDEVEEISQAKSHQKKEPKEVDAKISKADLNFIKESQVQLQKAKKGTMDKEVLNSIEGAAKSLKQVKGNLKQSARLKELTKSLEKALKAARECKEDCAVEWETVEEISDAKEREQAKGN